MNPPVSVSFGPEGDEQGNPLFILKIQKDDWEINVWMRPNELTLIRNVKTARWDNGGSIRLGECAGAPTFWSCEDGTLTILVGQDDESWDFAVSMPEAIIDQIIAEIDNENKNS